jgi:hypothetical protein
MRLCAACAAQAARQSPAGRLPPAVLQASLRPVAAAVQMLLMVLLLLWAAASINNAYVHHESSVVLRNLLDIQYMKCHTLLPALTCLAAIAA